MKSKIISVFLVILIASCATKRNKPNDTNELRGKVKQIAEKSYGGRLNGDNFISNSIQKTVLSRFDEDGRMLEEVTKNQGDFVIKTQKNTYDSNGNLVLKEFFKGSGNLDYKIILEYDDQKRCIKKTGQYGDDFIGGYTLLRYDTQDRVVEEETVPGKPKLAGDFSRLLDMVLTKYSYDKDGNVVAILSVRTDKEQALFSNFKYNDKNKKVWECKINELGDTVYVAAFSYDSNGELLDETWKYSDKQRTYRIDYKNVKFDDKTNLILRYSSKKFAYGTYDYLTERVDDKREDIMTKREIEYY